ncbi:hypothetical protein GCK72_006976 [Caenorhabditis remanei]|uniref:Uncharacterized protein n=1 Tax=Caenorhabditis remanei TaxID=31234 RepID=A0A6A5HGS7_CAERE|nr:hypothetical protein GCK72_006976 [Caenorhabditis remanei]KAF1767018.1 hypothetical protein GCK72_006976 [Caenorhabditis remanei]
MKCSTSTTTTDKNKIGATNQQGLKYTDVQRMLSEMKKEKESAEKEAQKCKTDQDLAFYEIVKTKLETKKMAAEIEELQRRKEETNHFINILMDSVRMNRVKTEDSDTSIQGNRDCELFLNFSTSPTNNMEFLRYLPEEISKIRLDLENSKRIEQEVSMRNNALSDFLENTKVQTMENKSRLFKTIENLQKELRTEKTSKNESEDARRNQLEIIQLLQNSLVMKDQQIAQMIEDMKLTNMRNTILEGLTKQHEGIIAEISLDNRRLKHELNNETVARRRENVEHKREVTSLQKKFTSLQRSATRKLGDLKEENESLVEKNKTAAFIQKVQTTSGDRAPRKRFQIMSDSSLNRQVRTSETEKEKGNLDMLKVKIEEEDETYSCFDTAFVTRRSSPKRRRLQSSPAVSPKKRKV